LEGRSTYDKSVQIGSGGSNRFWGQGMVSENSRSSPESFGKVELGVRSLAHITSRSQGADRGVSKRRIGGISATMRKISAWYQSRHGKGGLRTPDGREVIEKLS